MKKRLIKSLSLTILAFVLLISNISGAYAAQGEGAGSRGTFEFLPGDNIDTTKPVDPELPEYPIDPDPDENGNNGSTGNTGELRIDYVSDFRFGSQRITNEAQKLHAELIHADAGHTESGRITVPNFVQVSDYRGNGAGWTLSVKQDDDFKVAGGDYDGRVLTGAQITLSGILANTNDVSGPASIPQTTLTLNQGEQEIMVAESRSGYGTHVAYFGEYKQGEADSALQGVTLDIPGNIVKMQADYKTTLTWTLSSVPGNDGGDEEEEEDDIEKDIDDADEGDVINIDGDDLIILEKNEQTGIAEVMMKDKHIIYYYNSKTTGWKWSTSSIRNYLYGTYWDTKIPDRIKQRIIPVEKKTNLPGAALSTNGDGRTEEIYLLSVDEFNKYKPILNQYYKNSNALFYLRSPYSSTEAYTMIAESGKNSLYLSYAGVDGRYLAKPAFTIQYKTVE